MQRKFGAVAAAWLSMTLVVGACGPSKAAQSSNVVVTALTASFVDPNQVVPSFDVAFNAGAGIHTYDIGVPRAILRVGQLYNYAITLQVTNFTGLCKATFKLVQNGTTLDSGVFNKKWNCASGDIWGWNLNGRAIPNAPGQATLIGTVSYGTQKATMSVPMVIEP